MSVVDEKSTEIIEAIEETWIEVKRKTRTQEPKERVSVFSWKRQPTRRKKRENGRRHL